MKLPTKWLVPAAVAAALTSIDARAAEPSLDEDLLEFLGSVDEVEDPGFQEYLADVDVRRVAKTAKPRSPAKPPAAKPEEGKERPNE